MKTLFILIIALLVITCYLSSNVILASLSLLFIPCVALLFIYNEYEQTTKKY